MIKLNDSFKKFKQDLLPKAYYDILKWIVIGIIVFVIAKIFSKELKIEDLLDVEVSLKIYLVIILCIISVVTTIIILKFRFKKKIKKLKKITYTDNKTGLKSFRLLHSYLEEEMNYAKKNNKPLSVIVIDIDNFRIFNEEHTPSIGDKVISEVGRLLLHDTRITDESFRRYETGDEFVVVSRETNITQAKIPAERKRKFIANSNFIVDDKVYKITVCCGIAQFKEESDTVETLLDRANYAMRLIAKKKANKNSTESAL